MQELQDLIRQVVSDRDLTPEQVIYTWTKC